MTDRTFLDADGRRIVLRASRIARGDICASVYAYHNRNIVGSMHLDLKFDWIWTVDRLFVAEDYRRAGIATAMYDFAYKKGYKPLSPSNIQSDLGQEFWRGHYSKRPANFRIPKDLPNRWCWYPNEKVGG